MSSWRIRRYTEAQVCFRLERFFSLNPGLSTSPEEGFAMEIVILIENSSTNEHLQAEFGLSLLVRSAGGTILFDMGSSAAFAENARKLDVDLAEVDCGVISHAHYDHGGGLTTFANLNTRAQIYTGIEASGDYYGNAGARMGRVLHSLLYPLIARNQHFCRYVGLDKKALSALAERHYVVDTQREILPDVFLLPQSVERYPRPKGNKYLLTKTTAGMRPDHFHHELIMVIREVDGLSIFTGCGHGGVLNMVESVQEQFHGERLKAMIGGFHLAAQPGKSRLAGSRLDVVDIATRLREAGIMQVITGHCTGEEACSVLREEFADSFSPLTTGAVYEI